MTEYNLKEREVGFEKAISWILITGVIISLVLEIAGVALYGISSGNLQISQDTSVFIRGHGFFSFIVQQILGENSGSSGLLLITAGITVLILTPYVRLLASVFYFAWQKNTKYVFITLFVLVVVTLSLTLH